MYRLLYTSLLSLLMPVILMRLMWRSLANPNYRKRVNERFAFIQSPKTPVKIWLHAVSVGETMAAKPLIEKLIAIYGAKAVLVTSTTPTGSTTVQRLFADRVMHYYFPYDLPVLVNNYLQRIQPAIFVCMETEIWPNLWHACNSRNIPVVLVNARLSARSTRRYKKMHKFVSTTLNNAALIACRNHQDAKNFKAIGAADNRVRVFGDIKSDIKVATEDRRKGQVFAQQWGLQRPVLVAASTHAGEDSLILDLYQTLKTTSEDLLLVIAPRHPERFPEVSALINDYGFVQQQRSKNEPFSNKVEVVLGDSMGEMMAWYVTANVVFMGGSLVPVGGHNPFEPLACSVPVVSGPHIFNFDEAFKQLVAAKAALIAANSNELAAIVKRWLTDKELCQQTGKNGLAIIHRDQGATERLVEMIASRIVE